MHGHELVILNAWVGDELVILSAAEGSFTISKPRSREDELVILSVAEGSEIFT